MRKTEVACERPLSSETRAQSCAKEWTWSVPDGVLSTRVDRLTPIYHIIYILYYISVQNEKPSAIPQSIKLPFKIVITIHCCI